MKSPWLAEGSPVIFMHIHSLWSWLKLPFQKVWTAFTWQRDLTLCQCFASCGGQNDFKILELSDLTMRHTFPLITALFFVTSSWHLSQMLAILLFYCVQELTAFSGVLTCLNYLYMPCVLITVKPNNTYLSLFIAHFYLAPSCFRTNMFLFIMVFLMTKCPELKITEDWQHCCCRAAQRWRWHDTAPLAVFVLPHCHTAHPSFAVPG